MPNLEIDGQLKNLSYINDTLAKLNPDNSLHKELSNIMKILPAYLKIIKTHFEKLRDMLKASQPDFDLQKSFANTPISKIAPLCQQISDEDVQMLKEFAYAAKHWLTPAQDTIKISTTESTAHTS